MTYKNLLNTASGIAICLFFAFPAGAQRTSNGGGGGGGGKSSGGGGGGGSTTSSARPSGGGGSSTSSARPSGGGGGSTSSVRPSGGGGYRPSGNVGVSRPPSGNAQRSTNVPQRNSGYVNRQGVVVNGNNGYAPRQGAVVNGNSGYQPRTGNTSVRGYNGVTAYRTSPEIGYGRGSYWGNHGYYYNNRGYYGTYYQPRLGYRCRVLPYGYYPFYWGDYQYFYSDGLYYQYNNEEYTVVEPPIGAQLAVLPDNAKSIAINGVQYYELNGVYYMPVTKDDGTVAYEVVGKDGELNTNDATQVQDQQPQGPQMGDIVTQLPPDCRKIKVSGQRLWVSPDGVYYQEQVDASGNKAYKIVGLPSDEPNQN